MKAPVALHDEPAWLAAHRSSAWTRYQSLPLPKRKDEDWRFANPNAFVLDSFIINRDISSALASEVIAASQFSGEFISGPIFANDACINHGNLSDELKRLGVVVMPWKDALHHDSVKDITREVLTTDEKVLGSAKFTSFQQAHGHSGVMIYVPDNVTLETPIVAHHWISCDGAAILPTTIIVAGRNSQVTVVDQFQSYQNSNGFLSSMYRVRLSAGAKVSYVSIQDISESSLVCQVGSIHADRDSQSKTMHVHLGGAFSRSESRSSLEGAGARSEMLSVTVAHGAQEFDQRTLQDHAAPHTWSDLLYKNSLSHRSKTIFQGLIRVEPNGKGTDAYQTNRNLLLNPEAEADSMPGLEILNDDVKCSHGATTGQIDEEELFYCLARGIKPQIAKQLVVFGFLDEVTQRIDHQGIEAEIRQRIESKFKKSAQLKMDLESVVPELPDHEPETHMETIQGARSQSAE